MHGQWIKHFHCVGLGEHVGWHIFFWRTQPSGYLNTGRHMQAFQKHKTTGCRKPGVQVGRALSKCTAGGGWARAMFGSPLEAFDSARAAMLSRCSRPQPQTVRPAQGSVEGHAPAEVRSILACCET